MRILTNPMLPFFLGLMLICSCATPYRPLKNNTGYSETTIASNQFRITFRGNADTPLERAYDFAMLRSAEVSQEHGFLHFAVLDVANLSSARSYTIRQPDMPYPWGVRQMTWYDWQAPVLVGSPYMDPILAGTTHEETRMYFKPGTSLTIQCFLSKPEKIFAFNAEEIRQQLKKKYGL